MPVLAGSLIKEGERVLKRNLPIRGIAAKPWACCRAELVIQEIHGEDEFLEFAGDFPPANQDPMVEIGIHLVLLNGSQLETLWQVLQAENAPLGQFRELGLAHPNAGNVMH